MDPHTSSNHANLLRFTTVGSVDDGKSTLIGRLLMDTKNIYDDQLEAVKKVAKRKGEKEIDLSLLTDGLAAEREQGITIDVAYRYFQTPKRKFIIADTPGHVQYTRNMVTGASTANLAIILIDARSGVLEQSRRHGFIASLLQVSHMIVAVNKIDLVDYSQEVFDSIVTEYDEYSRKLDIKDITYIPVSALEGDNVVNKSEKTPWYDGPTVLHVLENVHVGSDLNVRDFRFPVQYVIRPDLNFRGYAGRIVAGSVNPGEEIAVLPSGLISKVKTITTMDGDLEEAHAPQSVVLTLEDEIDISRGDMIVRRHNLPQVENNIDVILCWMGNDPLEIGKNYFLKHTTRTVNASITKLIYMFDVNTLHRTDATEHNLFCELIKTPHLTDVNTLLLNEIGRAELKLTQPIMLDQYNKNRETGSFIIIDPDTNFTVGAGMIRGAVRSIEETIHVEGKTNIEEELPIKVEIERAPVSLQEREERYKHKTAVIWFTGLSGAGKSTIAKSLERLLFSTGIHTALLDWDKLYHGLCKDLSFSDQDRIENTRRAGEVARVFYEHGSVVLCTFVSPLRCQRDQVKALIPEGRFIEVFVRCSLQTCVQRDPRGLYKKAMDGEIPQFTGINSPYEEPLNPDIILDAEHKSIEDNLKALLEMLKQKGIIRR
ncbi:MAG: sulfate adenylyltransferase subunit CysN [Candidatus Scalindua sp.]|jgi:bifunctional enzyme CysN/CysC|nr:sulfate adenylyltransferase subunit CysN [Candidatus Scalindua sp.]MBT5306827.1 sulfate adenylyltransferase subunit CysN [Candidatus Scalindua sp.]MBT6048332.1 sulfate adenylyltransferase subunit CysN [Candidatus Scalindua sp.]MBT6563078.1 sulfate adenylyltransferase subunit CysN [Candidatus Scalindua sp.]MBT7212340.1 sulfate adenylyltransferase subunit CysN [Candidatus Scalindua sp.]